MAFFADFIVKRTEKGLFVSALYTYFIVTFPKGLFRNFFVTVVTILRGSSWWWVVV